MTGQQGFDAGQATQLGPDLTSLVAGLETPLVEAVPITGLPAPGVGRATFRLIFADGRVLKGRQLDTAAHASRISTIVGRLGRPELPRIVAHGGTALLEEWIAGEPLGDLVPDLSVAERCGRILGAIHATPLDSDCTDAPLSAAPEKLADPQRQLQVGSHHARAEWAIEGLLRDGILSASFAADLSAVARAHVPADVAIGFVHRDLCGENIVLGPGGDPFVVDSGSVGIDAFDLDLARTWYRWPLPEAARRAFEAGYRTHRDPESYAAQFPFWSVAVLADATLFRVRARTDGWRVPLHRLERLIEELRGGQQPS